MFFRVVTRKKNERRRKDRFVKFIVKIFLNFGTFYDAFAK